MRIRVVDEAPPDDADSGVTRRDVLFKGATAVGGVALTSALAACGGSSSSASSAAGGSSGGGASSGKVTLRVLGIGVDQNPVLKAQALKDLNINLVYTMTDTPTTTQKSITQPQNFDILHGYVHQVPQILPAGVMQPVDTSKISLWTGGSTLWDAPSNEPSDLSASDPGFQVPSGKQIPAEIAPILTQGRLTNNPGATYGAGDAAFRMTFLNPSDPTKLTTGSSPFDAAVSNKAAPSNKLIGMPGVFNVDSIGYDKTVIPHVDS